MKIEFVDLKRQLFGDSVTGSKGIKAEIDIAMQECIKNTSFTMGPFLEKFEKEFASFCDAQHCVGLNSGTDAVEFALRCSGISSGKVITIPNSYFTTASSISLAGAMPVFVDVDARTFNIDVTKIEQSIDNETRAIVVTHIYGRPCDMDAIMQIAKKHNLKVIEDCAHAPGARYKGKRVPVAGTGAFSFFPGKNMGAWGDGGALITDSAEVARLARLWRNDGWEKKYHHDILGRKARLDPLQATILSVKLQYLDTWNAKRREHAALYNKLLAGITGIQLPLLADNDYESVFHLYTIHTDRRDALFEHLAGKGIAVGVHYPTPIHLQPAYKNLGIEEGRFPVAERLAQTTLSLPMFPELRKDEIEYVCSSIKEFFSAL
ncbi:MAG TPA: DegT/DnrJ/EryC1/StrS family aminotransferase [Candidatus Nanoarchaeia archaeon]|nr:DegT/DnrJ/EryC1/StrS family aminotransferase [Candidatus Nanoarchaeia archaeon]